MEIMPILRPETKEKTIIKFDLDDKRIGTKPLFLEEYLDNVREKIKGKVNGTQFKFLDKKGKAIKKENERIYKLSDILYENNIIKLKKDALSEIKIIMNNVKEFTINASKDERIKNIRNLIAQKLGNNFIFLDQDGNNVDKEDENDYKIEDIINDNEIKLKNDKKENPFEKPTVNKIQFYKFEDEVDKKYNNMINIHKIENKKLPFNKKEKVIDFSKFEIHKKLNDITYYKYSKLKTQKPLDSVYLNYYDKYNIEYDEDIAYVSLFCGKTGDGKTTAINAFFNIIKGVKREDNYRFILIDEPQKNPGKSQTNGVHLYFVKDLNDKPVIIIDSAGFADTRGTDYDGKLNEAFNYVFSSLITHINSVNFVVKATDSRIGIVAQYIFSCVTSLFADNITENFIVLATHANDDTILEGPTFIKSIEAGEEIQFLQLNGRQDYWYSFDSKSILNNRDNELTMYSFNKMNEFYVKVKNLPK